MADASRNRRWFLRGSGLALSVGTTWLAGCSDQPVTDNDDPHVPVEPNYRGWFDEVSNYDGTVDWRGREAVTVAVGTRGNSGYYAYEPAAIAVTPGTTVTWEWTGRGGTHNVVAEQGTFDSGQLVSQGGHTFPYTFERPGTYKYFCDPHRSLGMKGAVFVTLE